MIPPHPVQPNRQPASHRYFCNALVPTHRQVQVPTPPVRMNPRRCLRRVHQKKRNKELPWVLICPNRCLPALESSMGIIPTLMPIYLLR
jgi:hypothetical protein